jgi:hypothetical protein
MSFFKVYELVLFLEGVWKQANIGHSSIFLTLISDLGGAIINIETDYK